jgi:Ferritin-like domain
VTRRDLLLAAAGAALVRPGVAVAAADDDPAILLGLLAREEAAALAYRQGPGEPLPGVAAHEAAHAQALRTQLEAYGREDVPPPRDDASELDGPERALADAARGDRLDAAIALESSFVEDYRAALPGLAVPGVLQTAATILASHAQHRVRLRRLAGLDPLG